MTRFHGPEYINFLKSITPELADAASVDAKAYGLAADCPVFDGLYNYCQVRYDMEISNLC